MRRLMMGLGDVVQNAHFWDRFNPLSPAAPDVPQQDLAAFSAIVNSLATMTAQGQEAVLAMAAASDGGKIEYRRNLAIAAGAALIVGGAIGAVVAHKVWR